MISVWDIIFLIPLSLSLLYLLRPALSEDSEEQKGGGAAISHEGASVDLTLGEERTSSERAAHRSTFTETFEDNESDSRSSLYLFLNFLGAGRMDGAVAAQIFVASWGLTGLLCNRILSHYYADPVLFVWLSATLAFLFSVLATRMIASLGSMRVSSARSRHRRLIGCEGQAMHRVTLEGGVAQIYDDRGALHQVQCRIAPDGIVIQEGDRIRIVDYDSEEDRYLVKAH